jgi:acetaldehyde dehydrogenase (acetylating)
VFYAEIVASIASKSAGPKDGRSEQDNGNTKAEPAQIQPCHFGLTILMSCL